MHLNLMYCFFDIKNPEKINYQDFLNMFLLNYEANSFLPRNDVFLFCYF